MKNISEVAPDETQARLRKYFKITKQLKTEIDSLKQSQRRDQKTIEEQIEKN